VFSVEIRWVGVKATCNPRIGKLYLSTGLNDMLRGGGLSGPRVRAYNYYSTWIVSYIDR